MKPGDCIAGRFELERLAGEGGMGVVYRARDRLTGGAVAIKLMRGGGDIARFEREARALAELDHPAIVRYVSHGTAAAGELYLAMQWLDGEDLAARLHREPLTLNESVDVARLIAGALGAAHAQGLVHRDVKPSNVVLTGGDVARATLVDFGVARRGVELGATRMTKSGVVIGTPGYLAPEQARGDAALDARADVFSLGCVLFECVAGRPAFEGDHVLALLGKILLDEPPRLGTIRPDVPRALEELVTRMLEKQAADRPHDGAEVERLLSTIALGEMAGVRPASGSIPAVTTGEQRLVGVVLAASPRGLQTSDTLNGERITEVSVDVTDQLDAILRAVSGFGARVEPLASGGFVAMLAGSGGATNEAAQAARCALAMRALLPQATIALVTGRTVVGHSLLAGAAFEAAARLVRTASKSVLIDDATATLLAERFDVAQYGARWELWGERTEAEPVRELMGRATQCFGRERELAMCASLFDECKNEPAARALIVTAAAGVGKSRLRSELLRSLRARGEPVEVWVGRGDPTSAGSAFAMIGPALRRAAGVVDGSPVEQQRAAMLERFGRHVAAETRQRVVAFIGELASVPFPDDATELLRPARRDPIVLGDQMMLAWLDLIDAETRAHPLVLVLEDLHWGDYPSVRFADAALREHRERPLMVLALARPEIDDLFPKLFRERDAQVMRLEGLSKRSGEALVRAVLGSGVSTEAVARIVEHAGGNAFYLEELTRALGEGRTELPESVLAMVEARLLALDPEARRILRAASIFGGRCWRGGVAALLGREQGDATLDAQLRALRDQNFLEARATARFAGEREYVFRHAIVREAAYGMLLDDDRAHGHGLAATWLEAQGERDAVVVAEHFERGREPARAAAQWLRATQEALAGNDLAAAVERADRGLRCTSAADVAATLCLLKAEAHLWRGERAAQRDAVEQVLATLPRGSAGWLEAAGGAVITCFALGDSARALELGEQVVELVADTSEPAAAAIALARIAGDFYRSGELIRGEVALRAMERVASAGPEEPYVGGFLHRARALRALVSGDPARFLEHEAAAAACFERVGNVRRVCAERSDVAYALGELGCYAQAEAGLRSTIEEADRLGLKQIAAAARHNLGLVLARQGKLDEALRFESAALEVFCEQNARRLEAGARRYLAEILSLVGDFESAEREARAASAAEVAAPARAPALAALARVLLARGQPTAAREAAAEASALLESLGSLEEGDALVRLMEAETLQASGAAAAAHAAMSRARVTLLDRARKISRDDLRQSFLENIPEHARTLELAKAWLDDAPNRA